MVRLYWPLSKATEGVSGGGESSGSRGAGGLVRKNRIPSRGDRILEYIPYQNWEAAQIQEEEINQVLNEPNSPKKEERMVEISPPEQVQEQQRAKAILEKEREEQEKKARKEDKLKEIFGL